MKNKIVLIEWLDSKGITNTWEFIDETKPLKPNKCISVGMLIDDNNDYKTIVQSMNLEPPDNQQIIGRMTIPTCSIKKIKLLK